MYQLEARRCALTVVHAKHQRVLWLSNTYVIPNQLTKDITMNYTFTGNKEVFTNMWEDPTNAELLDELPCVFKDMHKCSHGHQLRVYNTDGTDTEFRTEFYVTHQELVEFFTEITKE